MAFNQEFTTVIKLNSEEAKNQLKELMAEVDKLEEKKKNAANAAEVKVINQELKRARSEMKLYENDVKKNTVYKDRWHDRLVVDSFIQCDTVSVVVEVEKPPSARERLLLKIRMSREILRQMVSRMIYDRYKGRIDGLRFLSVESIAVKEIEGYRFNGVTGLLFHVENTLPLDVKFRAEEWE